MARFLSRKLIRAAGSVQAKQGKGNEFGSFCAIDSQTSIGKHNYFGNYVVITKAKIGNYCSIGDHVVIGPGNHDYRNVATSALFVEKEPYGEFTRQDCLIGSDVWIGAQAIILRGVTVGHGAVIAANCVVTKDVPPFAIVVGVPGKVIKYRFDDRRIKQILDSAWFECDLDSARRKVKELSTLDQNL